MSTYEGDEDILGHRECQLMLNKETESDRHEDISNEKNKAGFSLDRKNTCGLASKLKSVVM